MSDRGAALRLFVALDLPEEHRVSLAARLGELAGELPPARWVPAGNLHATLRFLGSVDPGEVPELTAALERSFAGVAGFETRLSGPGTFPPGRAARVAWIGLDAVPELGALRAEVDASVVRCLGLEPDRRPFHPHVTVARPRRPWGARACERFVDRLAPGFDRGPTESAGERVLARPFPVADGVLYRSDLGSGGARYAAIERFSLATGSEAKPAAEA